MTETPGPEQTSAFHDDPPRVDRSAEEVLEDLRICETTIEALRHKLDACNENRKQIKADLEKYLLDMRRLIRESKQGRLYANVATGEVDDPSGS